MKSARAQALIIHTPAGRCPNVNDSAYSWDTGTSFSAPFVAGAAAIYLSDHPLALPAEVKAAILSTASQGHLDLSSALPGTSDAFLSSLLLGPPVAAASGPNQNGRMPPGERASAACKAANGTVSCDEGQTATAAAPSQNIAKPSVPSG